MAAASRLHTDSPLLLPVCVSQLVLTPFPRPLQGSVVSATPGVLLSSMTTEAVCERVRQMEGMDQSMTGQYSATIRKV